MFWRETVKQGKMLSEIYIMILDICFILKFHICFQKFCVRNQPCAWLALMVTIKKKVFWVFSNLLSPLHYLEGWQVQTLQLRQQTGDPKKNWHCSPSPLRQNSLFFREHQIFSLLRPSTDWCISTLWRVISFTKSSLI